MNESGRQKPGKVRSPVSRRSTQSCILTYYAIKKEGTFGLPTREVLDFCVRGTSPWVMRMGKMTKSK